MRGSLESQIDQMKIELDQKTNQNSKLSFDLDAKSKKCSTLDSQILELNEKMNNLQERLNQSLKVTEDLRGSLESQIDRMKIELDQKTNQNSKLSIDFDVKSKECSILESQILELNVEMNKLQKRDGNDDNDMKVFFPNVLEGLDVPLFEELHVVRRGIKLFEKDRQYRELTVEIEKMKKLNKSMVKSLTQQRRQLDYNPSTPPEGMLSEEDLRSRGLKVLENLSERESELLENGEDFLSAICEKFHECVSRMFEEANISLSLDSSKMGMNEDTSSTESPLTSSLYSCHSHPIEIDEEHPIRVDRVLRGTGCKRERVNVIYIVDLLDHSSTSTGISYLVLQEFGEPLKNFFPIFIIFSFNPFSDATNGYLQCGIGVNLFVVS